MTPIIICHEDIRLQWGRPPEGAEGRRSLREGNALRLASMGPPP